MFSLLSLQLVVKGKKYAYALTDNLLNNIYEAWKCYNKRKGISLTWFLACETKRGIKIHSQARHGLIVVVLKAVAASSYTNVRMAYVFKNNPYSTKDFDPLCTPSFFFSFLVSTILLFMLQKTNIPTFSPTVEIFIFTFGLPGQLRQKSMEIFSSSLG